MRTMWINKIIIAAIIHDIDFETSPGGE